MKISQTFISFIIVAVDWLLAFERFIEYIFSKKFQKWFLRCINKINHDKQIFFDDHDVKKINLNQNLKNAVLEFDARCLLIASKVFNVEIILTTKEIAVRFRLLIACRVFNVEHFFHQI